MEMNKEIVKDTSTKLFAYLLVIMLTMVLGVWVALFWLSLRSTTILYQFIVFSSMILLLGVGVAIGITIFAVMLLWYNKKVPSIIKNIMMIFIDASHPFIMVLGKALKYDKDTIRRGYTSLNNQLVLSNKYHLKGEEILILTPHCIQKSFCPHKITNDTNNCKRCGLCNVDQLLEFREQYGVEFRIVTGGTLARKLIMDLKPKAVIAIACERDLLSGLMDVKTIPLLAIVNKRPEGPCVNTEVDLLEVEKAIIHFIEE
ncbi:hypothetical protein SAMN05446037_1001351 [Anaerovirgula multivorans]|uniref:DUF116 domain-containing protein n=1 Tax=Anaerovirgula multivorans TaxID=312168 RepID=A0A239A6V8_9FIRM|nr:DUF116 domain-containing protein [Anaerovirgula multivorans]SNR90828.1 hypothetical protein SAMN05446037_1001351 [Anaerovirgula multivorans]